MVPWKAAIIFSSRSELLTLEVPTGMCALEEGAELIAFLAVEGMHLWKHCGSVCYGL